MLTYYSEQSPLSSPGRRANLLGTLPQDPAGVARAIHGLVVYEHVASAFYGIELSETRRRESHIRQVEQMLDTLLTLDEAQLSTARPPEKRLVGICRHYALLATSLLRDKGVPARVRVGFSAYFNPGYFEDHWVCEYWSAPDLQWRLLDAQIDDVWRRNLNLTGDVLNISRDQFLTASEGWMACRRDGFDPERFGIGFHHLRGLWFIASSLIRDLAALNKMEMLAWDVWGAQPAINATLGPEELAYFDELARLTLSPDQSFEALRARYESDASLRVPSRVFNALTNQEEPVFTADVMPSAV